MVNLQEVRRDYIGQCSPAKQKTVMKSESGLVAGAILGL